MLMAAGDFYPDEPDPARPIVRRYSAKPYVYDPVPKRDERFTDP